jgi:ABC-type transport system involved in multi-copper enzyme maturation permease subunit
MLGRGLITALSPMLRSVAAVLSNTRGIIAVTYRSKAVVVLVIGATAIGPAIVSFHGSVGGQEPANRLIVFESPDPNRLAPVHHLLSPTSTSSQANPPILNAFFSSGADGRTGQALGTRTLDDVYRFLLPLVMILIGSNLLPQRRRIYASLFSLPGGRGAQYLLHVLAMVCLVVLVMVLIFMANLITVFGWYGASSTIEVLPLLIEYHLAFLLYAFGFAAVGFLSAVLFTNRSTGIIAAIAVFVLLVAVVPQVYLAASQTYVRNHADQIQAAGTTEVLLQDPLFVALRSLSRLPGDAVSQVLMYLPDLHRPEGDVSCATCMSRAEKRVVGREAYLSMGVFAAILLAVAAAVFLRKEVYDA